MRLNAVLIIASIIAFFLACLLGSTPMEPGRVFAALSGQGSAADMTVIWQIRLPRVNYRRLDCHSSDYAGGYARKVCGDIDFNRRGSVRFFRRGHEPLNEFCAQSVFAVGYD